MLWTYYVALLGTNDWSTDPPHINKGVTCTARQFTYKHPTDSC